MQGVACGTPTPTYELSKAFSRSAASRSKAGITWEYVFTVNAIVEWPSISMTTRGCTPWASSSEGPYDAASGTESAVGHLGRCDEIAVDPGPVHWPAALRGE